MKNVLSAFAVLHFTAAVAASQWVEYIESPATFTLALTVKTQDPGTFVIDPETNQKVPSYESSKETYDRTGLLLLREDTVLAGKVASLRYGNAELLKDLLNAGELGDEETTISGWSIVSVDRGGEDAQGNYRSAPTLIARKNGRPDVDLSELLAVNLSSIVSNYNFSQTFAYKYDANGTPLPEDQGGVTVTGKGAFADEGYAELNFSFGGLYAIGTMTERGSEFRYNPDPANKSIQEAIILSGGVRIMGLVGSSEGDENIDPVFVTGTVSLGATRAIKVQP